MRYIILKLIPFFALLLIFALEFRLVEDRSQSIHFVDEEDHIVIGDLMNKGRVVYKDMSTNHQPVVYLFSSAVNRITQPQNIFMLLKRHREAIFVYAFIWSLILVYQFGYLGVFFALFFEFLKFYLLGNLELSESLAVYPAVYIIASYLNLFFTNTNFTRIHNILIGISAYLVVFNLVPLWPLLAILFVIVLFKDRKAFFIQSGIALLCTALMFAVIPPLDWFRETVLYNISYAIPRLSPIKSQEDYLKLFFFPFRTFLQTESFIAGSYRYFFSGIIACSVMLGLLKKRIYYFLIPGIYFTLFLANNRVIFPESVFYEGFHLLPWVGILIVSFLFVWRLMWLKVGKKRKIALSLLLGCWGLLILLNKHMPYFAKTNITEEHFINYSVYNDATYQLTTLSHLDDRIAVISSEPLVYWGSHNQQATRMIVYYPWQLAVPELKKEFDSVMSTNPPEFLYGSDDTNLLRAKYVPITKAGVPTEMFVRIDKAGSVTGEQLKKLQERSFDIDYEWTGYSGTL